MFIGRRGRMGPVALVLRWLLRALGLGFVAGAALGIRAGRRSGGDEARVVMDRLERAVRVLVGKDEVSNGAGAEAREEPPKPPTSGTEAGT